MIKDVPVVIPTCLAAAQKPDGKLTPRFWSQATMVSDFKVAITHDTPAQPTEVRICYDRQNLYIRLDCFESSLDTIVRKCPNDDDRVWTDDCIHVLISPRSAAAKYTLHRFIVSAAGGKTHMPPSWATPGTEWAAAVTTGTDRWVAEIVLPLDQLRPAGRNEDCWRINFCRDLRSRDERSTWSPIDQLRIMQFCAMGRMVSPSNAPFRFNSYRGTPTVLVGRAESPGGAHPLSGMPEDLSVDLMIPEPQEVHRRASKAGFQIENNTKIVINDRNNPSDMAAVNALNSSVQRLGGSPLSAITSSDFEKSSAPISNVILLGESARNPSLRKVCDEGAVRMPRSRYGTSSYVLDVTADRALASGQSPAETYQAAESLRHLIRVGDDGALVIPSISVRDYPRFKFRGLHLTASSDVVAGLPRLVESVLAPLKVNHILLGVGKANITGARAGASGNPVQPEDLQGIVRLAGEHYVQVSPKMPERFLEKQHRTGIRPLEEYLSLVEQVCDIFDRPPFLHVGGSNDADEMRSDVHPGRYVEGLIRIHDELAARDCTMMMWGDVMIRPGYAELIDQLPKDILIADRSCTPGGDCGSLDFYRSHGFPVILCTWYEPGGSHTLLSRAARHGIAGVMQTPSMAPHTEELPPECERDSHAIVHAAAWAWNPTRPDPANLPYRPQSVFERLWREGTQVPTSSFLTVDLKKHFNIARCDSGRSIGWLGEGRGNDLRDLPSGEVSIDGIPYDVGPAAVDEPGVVMLGSPGLLARFPRTVEGIDVGVKLKRLHFLHSCAHGADSCERVATFVIHYEDGTTAERFLEYRRQTFAWDDQSPEALFDFVWKRKTQDGRTIGVCDTHWDNRQPDKVVRSVDFRSEDTQASPFLLAITVEQS